MISVIIPTYNRAAFLREALESVCAQTYFHDKGNGSFEILVIDDGSTDETEEVALGIGHAVRYERQEHQGVSRARNRGLSLANGEWIAFLDSDDLWKERKIEAQMAFLKDRPDAMICLTEEIWIRRGVRVNPRKKHQKYSGWVFEKFLPLCLLSLSTALFRKKLFEDIGGFDESFPACEDYDLGLRLALRYPVHLLPGYLVVKRGGHPDQLSRVFWGMDRFRIRALEKTLDGPLSGEQRRLVHREIVRKSTILVNGFEKRGKTEDAETYRRLILKYGEDVER